MRQAGLVGVAIVLLTSCSAQAPPMSPATVTVVATPTPGAPTPSQSAPRQFAGTDVPVAATQYFGRAVRISVPLKAPGRAENVDGTYRGLDVEIAVRLAAALGTPRSQIEWVDGQSAVREMLIGAGQADFAIGSYAISPKRRESVDFAGPYLIARRDLLVRRSETKVSGPSDLNGRKLCSLKGSTMATGLVDDFALTVELVEANDYEECVSMLTDGRVDAITTDDLIMATLATALSVDGQVRLVGQSTRATPYGIGMQKGSLGLCTVVAGAMDHMWQDGTMERLLTEWTGTTGYQVSKARAPSPTPCDNRS